MRTFLVWASLSLLALGPAMAAAFSPLLAWREPVYIGASFAGIIAFALLLFQPLLASGQLLGLTGRLARRVHPIVGFGVLAGVIAHIVDLWITSPPDVVDALLFASPTPFSLWGVLAMWALFAAAALALTRTRLKLHFITWRRTHIVLKAAVVVGTVLHVLLIDGTMEPISKIALCAAVICAALVGMVPAWRRTRP